MKIIIGGPGSTGSSLLRQVLNRHSRIFCGPESRILSLPQLYLDWKKYKYRLLKKAPFGLRSGAFHNITGIDLTGYEKYWTKQSLKNLVESSNSFDSFIEHFSGKILNQTDSTHWAEKTPNNIYCIQSFLETFPNSKAIITLRDPLEIIASQTARGKSSYQAMAHCLIHYALSLAYKTNKNVHFLHYEDLIANPLQEIKKLMSFLVLNYEDHLLESDQNKEEKSVVTHIKGWRYDESEAIAKSINPRFHAMDKSIRDLILYGIEHLSISAQFPLENNIRNFSDLYDKVHYSRPDFSMSNDLQMHKKLKREMLQDKLFRWRKMQIKFLSNYPITLS